MPLSQICNLSGLGLSKHLREESVHEFLLKSYPANWGFFTKLLLYQLSGGGLPRISHTSQIVCGKFNHLLLSAVDGLKNHLQPAYPVIGLHKISFAIEHRRMQAAEPIKVTSQMSLSSIHRWSIGKSLE